MSIPLCVRRSTNRPPALRECTGLDLGAHAAKLVVRRWRDGCWRVVRASCLRLSADATGDAAELGRRLRPWLRAEGEPGCRSYVATLASGLVDYESLELPATEAGFDCEQFAQDAVEQVLGSEARLAAHDYWTSAAAGAPGSLHLAWTASGLASELVGILARDGWRCLALDAPAAALARLAHEDGKPPLHRLTVDVGAGEASLVWSRAGVAEYVRNRIRFAPQAAAAELPAALGVGGLAAETLLAEWGVGEQGAAPKSSIHKLLARSLDEWLGRLTFEVRRTLQYLQHRHGPKATAEVVLCGGGACIAGLASWLQTQLELPVRLAAVPQGWRWESAAAYSPLYAQALALTQLGDAP